MNHRVKKKEALHCPSPTVSERWPKPRTPQVPKTMRYNNYAPRWPWHKFHWRWARSRRWQVPRYVGAWMGASVSLFIVANASSNDPCSITMLVLLECNNPFLFEATVFFKWHVFLKLQWCYASMTNMKSLLVGVVWGTLGTGGFIWLSIMSIWLSMDGV